MIATKDQILNFLHDMDIHHTITLLGDRIMIPNYWPQHGLSLESITLLLWSQGWTNSVTVTEAIYPNTNGSANHLYVLIQVPVY